MPRRDAILRDAPATISVRGLKKSYGDLRAVDEVTFEVGRGEFFGILGPNGAGKTTTLEIIEGLRQPDAGQVSILGLEPWPRNPALLPRMGVQLQASSFFEHLTAREQLGTFAALYGVPASRADELLETGRTEPTRRPLAPRSCPAARPSGCPSPALSCTDPKCCSSTSPPGRSTRRPGGTCGTCCGKISAAGRTVVLTTQHMDEAEALCERVAIMDHGRILQTGAPAALIRELDQPVRISVESGQLSLGEARFLARRATRGHGRR